MYYGTPPIVTDGLILYLDAANKQSYPGTGTVWNDLSTSRVTGAPMNPLYPPVYVTEHGGGILFPNRFPSAGNRYGYTLSQDVLRFGTGDYTVEVVLNVRNSYGSGYQPIIATGNDLIEGVTGTYFSMLVSGARNSILLYNGAAILSYEIPLIIRVNQIITFSKKLNTVSIYKNGVFLGSSTNSVAYHTTETNGTIILGAYISPTFPAQQPFDGTIYSVKAYNRALTQQEILQNYNATKSRFNLT